MTTIFDKRPAGEIVNPHVFEDAQVPKPSWMRLAQSQLQVRSEYYEMGALIQLLDWCSEEIRKRNAVS